MPIKPPNLSALSKVIKSAMDSDFLTLARRLREVHDIDTDMFPLVIEAVGISTRKAYALIQIDRSFWNLNLDRDRLLSIGWPKTTILARHINQENCEQLLSLAEEHNVDNLAAILSSGVAELFIANEPLDSRQHVPFISIISRLANLGDDDLNWLSNLIDTALRPRRS